jgi:hypothetical protein
MSKAKITDVNTEDNIYTISIAGWGSFEAQCVTGDIFEVDDAVEIVDIDNLPPDQTRVKGRIRLMPVRGGYAYTPTCLWYSVEAMRSRDKVATLTKNFIFSNKQNPRWQRECPIYRKGWIVGFEGNKYAEVRISKPWKGTFDTLRCRIDYMTCDGDAFSTGDEVVVKFLESDERRGVVVGFWEEPGLCQGFLYFALRIDRVITEDEVFQRPISESSESGSESSESVASGVSVSESSGSEQLKGLDEYYCFLWDPQINDFPVILDDNDVRIEFPCRADKLADFLSRSADISSVPMTRIPAGAPSVLRDASGPSKDHFYNGNWNIEDFYRCVMNYVGGGPWLFDGTMILDRSEDSPDKWPGNYWYTDLEPGVYPNWGAAPGHDSNDCCSSVAGVQWPGRLHWWDQDVPYADCAPGGVPVEICPESCDSHPWAWAARGTFYENRWEGLNVFSGLLDYQFYSAMFKCDTTDQRSVSAESLLHGVYFTDDNWPIHVFPTVRLTFDGFESSIITTEYHEYDKLYEFTSGCAKVSYDDLSTVGYKTLTPMGYLYGNGIDGDPAEYWIIEHYNSLEQNDPNYHADCLIEETFSVGRRCQTGTFVWLGMQGTRIRLSNWGDPPDYPTLVVTKESSYGFNPFDTKQNNTRISGAIDEIIDRFYAQQEPGVTLDLEYDVRWISGASESYSSYSSSSLSSSSLSSSEFSESSLSLSSSNQSSYSSEESTP